MRHVTLDDIVGLERYEQIRDSFRARTIELKKARRVGVGDRITFVFENFDTVLFQIQEMLRAERISDVDKVREEIAAYDSLIPGSSELSATMLIELDQTVVIRDELPKFYGIDQAVWLELDAVRIQAVFEEGRAREDKVSAVQYVRFPLGDALPRLLEAAEARIVIEHPHYRASQVLPRDVRTSLAADFQEPKR